MDILLQDILCSNSGSESDSIDDNEQPVAPVTLQQRKRERQSVDILAWRKDEMMNFT
jgi:hypothetical protein